MKKYLLLFLVSSFLANAQSLQIASADTVVYGNANQAYDIESHINITNVSGSPVSVKVKRIDKNYNALTDSNAICWQTCFAPHISVSPNSLTIAPNQTTDESGFIGHVYADGDGASLSGDITYVFYNELDTDDSVAHTVTYTTTQDFSAEEQSPLSFKVYPNPASSGHITVNYSFTTSGEASMELINMVGTRVYERQLNDAQGEFRLDISKLSRGVYFYILRSNGETVITKKLIVE